MGIDNTGQIIQAIPWAWYFARAGGLIAFVLLYFSIFFGLTIRLSVLKKILAPIYSFELHKILSVQAFIFTLIHGLALLGDKYLNFSLADIFLPFSSTYHPEAVAMGIFGIYLMLALILTSYFRRFVPYRVWRVTHFLNIILYAISIAHALHLGTDLQGGYLRGIFIGMNIILSALFLLVLGLKLKNAIIPKTDENLS